MAKLTYGDGTTEKGSYTFEYDSLGRQIRSVEYDDSGNLVQRTEQLYDEYSRLESQSWVIGTSTYSESYTYDDPTEAGASGDGSLSSVTTATGDTLSYTYDTLRRVQKETVTNAQGTALLSTAYDFATVSGDQTSMQVKYRNVRLGNDDSVLEGNRYTYDGVGNIIAILQSTGNYYPLVKYSYDELGQMVKEVYYDGAGDADSNITATYDYTYDTAGNILTVSKNGTVTKTYTYGNSAWRDLLTAVDGTAITYENGNPLTYYNGEKSYTNLTWVQGRQLASITTGGKTYSYSYDADGIRTQKVVDGVTHTYITQNGKVVRESYGNTVLDFVYMNGQPFALNYSTNGGSSFATYYYVLNLQGDVVKLIHYIPGFEYAEMASYTYDAWGNILSCSGTLAEINPLRYRGYYYDSETGFYYLQSRYYDPANHRFINADCFISTGQGFVGTNMFAYCLNNPARLEDSIGCFPINCLSTYEDTQGGYDAFSKAVNDAIAIGQRATITYDTISIDMTSEYQAIRDISQQLSTLYLSCLIAYGACTTYAETYGEEFLLSDYCVGVEIEEHIEAYYWAIGDRTMPTRLVLGYMVSNYTADMSYQGYSGSVYAATASIDIRLSDVVSGAGLVSQATVFNYKQGIRKIYIGTERDPWRNER